MFSRYHATQVRLRQIDQEKISQIRIYNMYRNKLERMKIHNREKIDLKFRILDYELKSSFDQVTSCSSGLNCGTYRGL